MAAYYNEIDPFAAQWLRNLVAAGHIAPGEVDERSIAVVGADDIKGYTQCHFFAGIGGWSLALQLAGWPDERPVWTGSCPCQPFSTAGKGHGGADARHLWPHWFRLIRERRPATVLGEQVEAAIGWGWLDAVFTDLEAEGYATGAAVLPAAGVGAPHIRQRVWFVADAIGGAGSRVDRILGTDARQERHEGTEPSHAGSNGELVDAEFPRLQEQRWLGSVSLGAGGADAGEAAQRAGAPAFWSSCDWLPCTDGKARPTQSGLQPLAHGIPGRVGRLRAYGNAIVPQVAAEFIQACIGQ